MDLVKDKYKGFCESLYDLSHSLNNLYLSRMLGLNDEVVVVIREFEEFIMKKSLLEYSFMSKNGVYHQVSFRKIKVIGLYHIPELD